MLLTENAKSNFLWCVACSNTNSAFNSRLRRRLHITASLEIASPGISWAGPAHSMLVYKKLGPCQRAVAAKWGDLWHRIPYSTG